MSEKTKQVWVVWTNTDLTEGRGRQYPLDVCELKSTAIRLSRKAGVMGSDADVQPATIYEKPEGWVGPVRVVCGTKEDDEAEKIRLRKEAAIAKARELGLSEADINSILH